MFIDRANQYYKDLNQTEVHILNFIVQNINTVHTMHIDDFSKACNTSRATIYRFARKIGFDGFFEMKNYIKWEVEQSQKKQEDFDVTELVYDFNLTLSQLENSQQVEAFIDAIHQSSRVFVFGTGQAQHYCAQELQRLFMQIGVYLHFIPAKEELDLVSKTFDENTLVIMISLSGNVEYISDIMNHIKIKGAKIASVSKMGSSYLAKHSDINLYVYTSPKILANSLHHSSFFPFFFVLEYIFRLYISKYQ